MLTCASTGMRQIRLSSLQKKKGHLWKYGITVNGEKSRYMLGGRTTEDENKDDP